jgi:hypothetical protein
MRSLTELMKSPVGHEFLGERGVFLSAEPFMRELRPPAADALARFLGVKEPFVVYMGQQLQCDYPTSVTAKARTLGDLAEDESVAGVAFWLDMDRSGSNKLSSQLVWPFDGSSVRLAPIRFREREPRFIPVDRARLQEVAAQLGVWAASVSNPAALERHRRLSEALLEDDVETLADANLRLTRVMVRDHLRLEVPSILISDIAGQGLLTPGVQAVFADLEGLVAVFNAAVDTLIAADVDPQVRHLQDDYVPLRYSCPNDGTRCTLVHRRHGADHTAETTCRSCGTDYRFNLGAGTPSPAEIIATDRWSVDVSLPVYKNDLVSGVVVGRSSALYGLVLNDVVAKILGGAPVPMLVPPDLATVLESNTAGGLLADYLTGA